MSYATKADMIARYGEQELVAITNPDDAAATTVNDTVLTAALENAAAEVNSEAMLTGTVTLTDQLVNLTCQIARYRLTDPCPMDGKVRKDYEDAITFLRRVADGRSLLVGQDASEPTTSAPTTILVTAPPRIFSCDRLRNF